MFHSIRNVIFLTASGQLCPLWRHSPFSELQAFVKLFRPHRIIPNTLDPGLENLDWIAIDNMFRDCLSSHGKSVVDSIREDVSKKMSERDVPVQLDAPAELAGGGEKGDVGLKNLEGGDEAVSLATRWVTTDGKGLKKLQRIREHLPEPLKIRLEKGIPNAEAKAQAPEEERLREDSQARSERSLETDEDFYDDRGKTAHRLFAGSSFVPSERSSSTPSEEEAGFSTPISSPRKIQNHSRPLTASPTPPSTIFNQEYADWFKPITPPKRLLEPLPKTPEPKKAMNVLSLSTNKENTVHPFTTSKPLPADIQNPTLQTSLPSNLAPTPSSDSMSVASTLSPGSTKRSSKTPPSGSIGRRDRRRAEKEERQRIALKLGRARPDLVSKEFTEKFLGSVQEELR
jgi:hypothetical protein